MKGAIDKALPDLKKALEINPGNGKAYCFRGILYHCLGRQDQAMAVIPYQADGRGGGDRVAKPPSILFRK